MRGRRDGQERMFFTINLERRIAANHPLRPIKLRVDRILASMNEVFDWAYAKTGRPGVPPERLLKAMLLQAIYSIRSEEQLVQRIDTDLLFRWFLGMDPAEDVFDPTAFAHNRERLREHAIVSTFFDAVLREALEAELCSDHFSVDGTLLESYASTKSFQPKATHEDERERDDHSSTDELPPNTPAESSPSTRNNFKSRNPEVDFHGQKRTNNTHASRTDPEAKLYRKGSGQPAILAHMGHVLSENRHGLIMRVQVTEASGMVEREAALSMLEHHKRQTGHHPKTIGADKGYDSGEFCRALEQRGITPHCELISTSPPRPENVAPCRRAAVDARERMKARITTSDYQLSQRCRKKVEECFGWLKTIAGLARLKLVGHWKIQQQLELSAAAFNLVRLRKLLPLT
ncbi:MAG: IS5 family transposase [Planctomycetaceae bacterium]